MLGHDEGQLDGGVVLDDLAVRDPGGLGDDLNPGDAFDALRGLGYRLADGVFPACIRYPDDLDDLDGAFGDVVAR